MYRREHCVHTAHSTDLLHAHAWLKAQVVPSIKQSFHLLFRAMSHDLHSTPSTLTSFSLFSTSPSLIGSGSNTLRRSTRPLSWRFLRIQNLAQFIDNDERDQSVTSANILKKELRGRKIRMSPAMVAEERFHQKRVGDLKWCFHTRHNVPLVQIKMNRLTRHVSVDGQIVIRTCANGSLKYHKYQDIEAEVEETMKNDWLKTRRNDCEQSIYRNPTKNWRDDYV